MSKRYNPPPNWPAPPQGWTPPVGWQPDPNWGPAPDGWKLWIDDRNWFARHKLLTAIGALVALFVAIAIGSSNSSDTVTTTPAADAAATPIPAKSKASIKKAPPTKKKAGIGTPVRDGKFEFVVTKVETAKSQVGNDTFGRKAQGQFVFVHVSVKNIGKVSQSLFGENQYMFDQHNRKASADTEAAIYMDESNSLYEEINPGNKIEGVVVFDIPKDAVPTKLELHDSAFSGGVDVFLK